MSDFFQPPPPPPPPPEERIRHRPPEWAGPPQGTLPGVVPLELVLARSEVAITVTDFYPSDGGGSPVSDGAPFTAWTIKTVATGNAVANEYLVCAS
jgi:hypothetical protein